MKVRVFITLKPEVLDPQGKAVESALRRLGFSDVTGTRVGRCVEFSISDPDRETAAKRVSEMCQKLLSNPVIEDSRYEFTE